MKEYTIFTDLHMYGAHDNLSIPFEYSENTAYLGDNIDSVNTKKSKLKEMVLVTKAHHLNVEKFNCVKVRSNHGGILEIRFPRYVIRDKILFCHGHSVLWSHERAREWEHKNIKGLGRFAFAWRYAKNKMFPYQRGSKKKLKKLAAFAKEMGCTTIVAGHIHPKKLIDVKVGLTRVVVAPRGKSVVEL